MRNTSTIVRTAFFTTSLVHGLLHLSGFMISLGLMNDRWRLTSLFSIPNHEYKIAGTAFLITTVVWIWVALALVRRKQSWWKIGIPAVLISQTIILLYASSVIYGTITNACLLVLIVLSFFKEKFKHRVQRETKELLRTSGYNPASLITEETIQGLPPIIQKWLKRSNVLGTMPVQTVRIKQKGTMRTKPTGKWMEMKAEQFIITQRPGFIWSANINVAPFISIKARDLYKEGEGSMLIKAMNMMTIANSNGDEIDQGSLMRYLAEIIWLPSAALCDFIRWEYVNDTAARAVIKDEKSTGSGLFTFDANGDVISFEGKRYAELDNRYSLETWFIKISGYKEFNGVRIGHKSQVSWKLKTGDFHWLNVEVTEIEYNIPKPTEPVAIWNLQKDTEGKYLISAIP